jgi:glycosyltransferase involved in cell wall biosynthesis
MKTTLIIPTLNEFECMQKIMPRINKKWVDEIIIVDGGSTDGTVEYAKKHNLFVFAPKVKGLSAQLLESFKIAKGDIIVLFSPDGNSIPELIPNLVEKMKQGYDMVIVSRYAPGAKSYDDDFFTRIGNYIFTSMTNLFFRANYTDTLVIFRAFKKNVIEKIKFDVRWDVDLQLSIRCAKKKLKTADMPGDEPKRVGGKRKINIIGTGFQLLSFFIKELFSR